jgi:alpha-N-arabinofuranosidase
MANFSGLLRRLIRASPEGLALQASFYPFELYSRTCGQRALDIFWEGKTFAAGGYTGIRTLDVSATLDEPRKQLVVYVINRSQKEAMETTISLADGQFAGGVQVEVVNGPDIKAENTFDKPDEIGIKRARLEASGKSLTYSFEPHSATALVCVIS